MKRTITKWVLGFTLSAVFIALVVFLLLCAITGKCDPPPDTRPAGERLEEQREQEQDLRDWFLLGLSNS